MSDKLSIEKLAVEDLDISFTSNPLSSFREIKNELKNFIMKQDLASFEENEPLLVYSKDGTSILEALNEEVRGYGIPEKYKKALELREKIKNLEDSQAEKHFWNAIDKMQEGKNLTEEEKVAILRILRYPGVKSFRSMLVILFKLSIEKGKNILEDYGIKAGISPTTMYKMLTEKPLNPEEIAGIIYFTDFSLLDAPSRFLFLREAFNTLTKDENYSKTIVENGEAFWEKLNREINKDYLKDLFKFMLVNIRFGVTKTNPAVAYVASLNPDLHSFEVEYLGKINLSEILKKFRKNNWPNAYNLVERARRNIEKKIALSQNR